jgi:glycosyltransferase involved in cell wall biosynthesis
VAAYLRALIPLLLDAGHQVTLFANANETRSFEVENERARVHHFRLPSAHWYLAKLPLMRRLAVLPLRQLEWSTAFYRRVATVAAREKLDVIECGEAGALFLNRIAPLVVRLHGSEFSFRKHSDTALDYSVRCNDFLEAYSSNRAVAVTTPSQYQADEIVERRGWGAERVRVIPNPISSDIWKAALGPTHNGHSESIVLYTGRLAPVKGIETLLKAAERLHLFTPETTVVLAGPWQMPHAPRRYGLELNVKSEHGVLWVGPQEPSELAQWYKRALLFVMPSYFESFGISVVEAMAYGLPVVCARAGAITETVNDGVTGLMVEPRNSEELADTMLQLLSDSNRRASLGRAGQAKVVREFDPREVARKSLEVYRHASTCFCSTPAM